LTPLFGFPVDEFVMVSRIVAYTSAHLVESSRAAL
jgi:hypothetical protein